MGRMAWSGAVVMVLALLSVTARAQEAGPAWSIPSNDDIHKLLAERMRHNGVGTVVGVIEPSGTRVVSFGRSGAPDGRALDGDTVFQMGSLSKTFVGLLLADMVRRGDVALDDPAQKYLPAGVKMPLRGRPITLIDLSTHRSGLPSMPDNFRAEGEPNPIEAYTVDDLWQFLSRYQLPREPGEKFEYSNTAVSLLGRLLAMRAGKKDYETLLKERVLEPLGMRSTAITVSASMRARLAPGHGYYLTPVHDPEMKTIQASGSVRSTANDMLRYIGAYLADNSRSPLADSMALQLRTRAAQSPPGMSLGWFVDNVEGREIYTHEGGKAGYRTAVSFDLRTRTGVVVLQNARTDDRPTAIANYLLTGHALPPAPAAPPPKPIVKLPPDTLKRYEGHYRAKDGMVTVLARQGQLLVVYRAGSPGLDFAASNEREFFYVSGNDDIAFELNGKGVVTGLRIYPDGKAAGTSELAPRVEGPESRP
jgi:CubicO group peptidase (beta-lactamase class C family)